MTAKLVKWNGKYAIFANGIKVCHSHSKQGCIDRLPHSTKAKKLGVEDFVDQTGEENISAPATRKVQKFNIDKRCGFMENLVDMVINKTMNSLIITGEPGTGKTYTVKRRLDAAGLREIDDYTVVKGFSTPKAMFRTMYENQDKLIIFDDCDSVLKDMTALNILKAGLDSYDKRIVTWNSEREAEDLPNSFEFKGQIIFISNMPQEKMNPAVMSRSLLVDVSMSKNEKIERMRKLLPELDDRLEMDAKEECLNLLVEESENAVEFNLRTLLKVMTIRRGMGNVENWKELASYAISG